MKVKAALVIAISLLTGALIAGCGGDSGGDGPGDRVEAFVSALQDDDYEAACGMLSDDGLAFVLNTSGNPPPNGDCALESIGFDDEQLDGYADGIGDVTEEGEDQAAVAGGSGDWFLT
ncbi:MAG TPA: hypothetical protein VF253_13710, partial [Candidatus Limnocylindrales bacterium]